MKTKISIKIFIILIVSFMAILTISMKINIESQKKLYCTWIVEKYKYGEVNKQISSLFNKYGIKQNEKYSREDIHDILSDEDFKKELNDICPRYQNYIFLSYFDKNNEIQLYSLGTDYDDNYLILNNGDIISIENVNQVIKEQLLCILKRGMYPNDRNELTDYKINYIVENNKLVYLKYELDDNQQLLLDDTFNNSTEFKEYDNIDTSKIKTSVVSSFCIDGTCVTYDQLNQTKVCFSLDKMKTFVKENNTFSGNPDSYVHYFESKNNVTYFCMNMMVAEEPVEFNINVVNVINNVGDYVFERYMGQNFRLYVISFIITIIISILASYMISKPIKRIEQTALKISNNEFDEEVKVKSKDEIGSLAKSIDIMRLNLKNTIEKLNQEIEHVKELESLRKDFINQFTHEMKTPLGIINGYSELIEEAEDEEEKQRYLDIINKETVRINELIQSMLKLSRLEAGKVELNIEEIDLEDIVTEVVDEYEVLLMKKNIKVEVNIKDKDIIGDRNQVITVIRNFLSNAIKHTDTKIVIKVDKGVSVYNEGKTIEEERIESIWYTFVTHDKNGTGLGLAICRSILELHHYKYGVINKENGVEFYFNDLLV